MAGCSECCEKLSGSGAKELVVILNNDAVKIEALFPIETLIPTLKPTLRYNQEHYHEHLHRRENIKS
jgi:hypothetical protein